MTLDPEAITQLLSEVEARPEAANELLPLVYDQLRGMAASRMKSERPGHTLQATALVHEVYAKLVGGQPVPCNDRRHFFALAAEAMRRILIDHARKHKAERRGGGRGRVPLSVVDLAQDQDPGMVLDLDAAITRLEAEDPRAGEVVRLRFFAGLTADETAEAMQVSRRTVMREWAFARARLLQIMGAEDEPGVAESLGGSEDE